MHPLSRATLGWPTLVVLLLVAWVCPLAASTIPSASAGAAPGLGVTVTSSAGSVLGGGLCHVSSTGSHVVASGPVTQATRRRLTLTLEVYSAEGSPMDLEGAGHMATLKPGARRWQVEATIVRGFAPARCALGVAAARSLERVVVHGSSMAPTVVKGSSVLVDRSAFTSAHPRPGDLVAVTASAGATCAGTGRPVLVLRVVGVGGQTVAGAQGAVTVDGKILPEPWLPKKPSARTPPFPAVNVPVGAYFVLGDDRARACDSRDFGAVRAGGVVGKVVKVIPPERPISTPSTYSSKETTPAITT